MTGKRRGGKSNLLLGEKKKGWMFTKYVIMPSHVSLGKGGIGNLAKGAFGNLLRPSRNREEMCPFCKAYFSSSHPGEGRENLGEGGKKKKKLETICEKRRNNFNPVPDL